MATKKVTKTEKPARETRNGQTAPTPGTKGALIWANINKAAAAKGEPISFGEATRANPDQNPLTVGLYYPRWRKFYGVTGRIPDPIVEAAKLKRQGIIAAKKLAAKQDREAATAARKTERDAAKAAAKAEREAAKAEASKAAAKARIERASRIAKASKASASKPKAPAKPKPKAPAKPRKCRKPATKSN